jgi:hypothetical protein
VFGFGFMGASAPWFERVPTSTGKEASVSQGQCCYWSCINKKNRVFRLAKNLHDFFVENALAENNPLYFSNFDKNNDFGLNMEQQ